MLLTINPHNRFDWLLENAPLIVCVVALVATYRALRLSRISYTLIALFLLLHSIGAHYTYSLVPWANWAQALGLPVAAGNAERNHLDRVVHLLYGLLLTYPLREILLRVADLRGFWGISFRSRSRSPPRRSTSSWNGAPRKRSGAILGSRTWVPRATCGIRRRTWLSPVSGRSSPWRLRPS